MSLELINNLGGPKGFGENFLPPNDDGSSGYIDLTTVFPNGLNFFGAVFDGLYVNNNGSVTFNAPLSSFTPSAISAGTTPGIFAFWADVDTWGGEVSPTPGGTSQGSNLVWYDLDAENGTFIVTWDDVGYYPYATNKLNAFQLIIQDLSGEPGRQPGDFLFKFRYEDTNWTTGGASGGTDGLGGFVARAGYSSGTGTYYELPQSGNQDDILALDGVEYVFYSTQTGVEAAPIITSPPTFSVPENGTLAADVDATDPDIGQTLTYAIVGGADQALFSIDAATGVVTFLDAPDHEAPLDANGDNSYVIVVRVTDDGTPNQFSEQEVIITVTDVDEETIINGTVDDDFFRLVGDSNDAFKLYHVPRGQPGAPVAEYSGLGEDAVIVINGFARDDTTDLRAFKGTAIFNGDTDNDLLQFQHGTSGAGSTFNGGDGRDSLQVFAQATGSNLTLTDSALIDEGAQSTTLVHLDSLEVGSFSGGAGNDTFDARDFVGQVVSNLGSGQNVFYSSKGNSNLVTRVLSNNGHDDIFGNPNYTTNLRIQGTADADNLVFAGEATTFTVRHNGTEVIKAQDVRGTNTFNGEAGNDTASARSFKGTVEFNGGAGNDLFEFQHGVSGAGSKFDGGADRDTVRFYAQASGSNIKLSNTALTNTDDSNKVLIGLANVEVGSLLGGVGNDTFDTSISTAQISTRLGGGTNVFYSSNANNNHVTHSLANANTHDTLHGFSGKTTNLVIEGTPGADVVKFVGSATDYTVSNHGEEVIKAIGVEGTSNLNATPIEVKGGAGNDAVDVTEFAGRFWFNAGAGDDTLVFKHNVSGANTRFNGDEGNDTLVVHSQAAGSTLAVSDVALTNPTTETLLTLESIEKIVFHGLDADDVFDASAFTGTSVLNGGDGDDTLTASQSGSEITGGKGADQIHLGVGADRVIYHADGHSTLTDLDQIHDFNAADDELLFAVGNQVQANKTLIQVPFLGSSVRFDNGVVEYRASQWSSWKTDLEDLSFGSLGITSLQTAANAVARFANANSVLAFEYDEEWYVIEVGVNRNVDNLVQLVGTELNYSTNLHEFVGFVA